MCPVGFLERLYVFASHLQFPDEPRYIQRVMLYGIILYNFILCIVLLVSFGHPQIASNVDGKTGIENRTSKQLLIDYYYTYIVY